MLKLRFLLLVQLLCFVAATTARAEVELNSASLLRQGWQALVVDDDSIALVLFYDALNAAKAEQDEAHIALANLQIGICQYSVSSSAGMQYALQALAAYKKLEQRAPQLAMEGRSRCLQLISTIQARQGHFEEAIALSLSALPGFPNGAADSLGYRTLTYSHLSSCYAKRNNADSASYYATLALAEAESNHNTLYLPNALIQSAEIALKAGNANRALEYYQRALQVAFATRNKQAQVNSYIGLSNYYLQVQHYNDAAAVIDSALFRCKTLSDVTFQIRSLEALIKLKKAQKAYAELIGIEEQVQKLREQVWNADKQHQLANLELQFKLEEQSRTLALANKAKEDAQLINVLLGLSIGFIVVIAGGLLYFLRRVNKREKLLLQTREALLQAQNEKRALEAKQMQHELEHKESQLSALALQMLQKNELLQSLQEKLNQSKNQGQELQHLLNKGMNQDKEWSDFNAYFESLNKNFYIKIKTAYPDISPNELKICALIKMNLSIKEMAGILNISPDSVKTARYRLRKKLGIPTEENLTDFILQLA